MSTELEPQIESRIEKIRRLSQEYHSKATELHDSARSQLPEEVKTTISPARLMTEGIGKIIVGTGIDVAGGLLTASGTIGLSELLPMEDYLVDTAVARLNEAISHREIRKSSYALSHLFNWVPILGDFVNPTAIDGAKDIWQASKAFYLAMKNNGPQTED
ncbi:hypothetical protein KC717_06975 [Candidatus Dojkabacteria bacterium]|uniref:Uncharacterized protein n=1 Tax=Candidatus Dojkabacteria bacterium TaxID=2099670 RepID=A0A955L951_9BACT|nr:hypothetical protein [Candidatus Dojkabacteria bacterium]